MPRLSSQLLSDPFQCNLLTMSCMVFGDVSQLTHVGRTEVLSTDMKFESGLQNFAGRLFSQFSGCCELQIYGHYLFVAP